MKRHTPLVSIILSTFNDEKFLKKTIKCLLDQTYRNIEIIIIDDASEDGTSNILEKYKKKYKNIRLIHNKKNIGLTKSLNIGITRSKGKYIARQDCDDFSYKTRISNQVKFLENNKDYVMCGTQRIIKDFRFNKKFRDFLPLDCHQIRSRALFSNPFFHSSVMIKKKTLKKVGYYNEDFKYVQDLELWSRIIFNYKTANLKDILSIKYIDNKRISFSKNKFLLRNFFSFKARYRIYNSGNYSFLEFFKMLIFYIKSL